MVPHQDVRGELRKFYDKLIKNGLKGVYRFPLVVPMAELSHSLTQEELKSIAGAFRNVLGTEKIQLTETATMAFSPEAEELTLFGHRLAPDGPAGIFDSCANKIISLFSPLLIGAFLVPRCKMEKSEDAKQQLRASALRTSRFDACEDFDIPLISFRAAAVANMYWRPIQINGVTAFKWKIGKLCWLPSARKKTLLSP